MIPQPLANARDADLRLSMPALERAAQRARELAAQTGTAIVIRRQGVVQLVRPAQGVQPAQAVHEPPARYGDGP